MGMTNRVIPAQGEERGASFTLIRLDGDAPRKFQPSPQQFCSNFYTCRGAAIMGRSPNIGRILPQIAEICMLFSCLERCPWPPLEQGPTLAALELRRRP